MDVYNKGVYVLEQLTRLAAGNHPEKNPMRQLALFKAYVPALVDYLVLITEVDKSYKSLLLMETPNERLAWTADEDDLLVESRAQGEAVHLIARDLGRTPAACATRLSTLTGIPRSQIVEAYIEGTLDHDQSIHGLFTGKVRRVAP